MRGASVASVRIPPPLVDAVMRARAEHPGLLESLAVAVQATANSAAAELVHMPAETFQQAQGRAQVWRALAELLAHPERAKEQLVQR